MPCPFFQPVSPVEKPQNPLSRLPLIRQYDGVCRAGETAVVPGVDLLTGACNMGYSRAQCEWFPAGEHACCHRYSVRFESADLLRIVYIEERQHTPVRWQELTWHIATGRLEGDADLIVAAQAEAFARSYLTR